MADLVLGIATSHTPMLTLPAELWASFSKNDERNPELAFPPHGVVMSYEEGLRQVTPEISAKYRGSEPYRAQAEACQRALDELSATLRAVNPDVTVIIGDDQDEWFFEDNMPALSVYWGDTAPLIPREMTPGTRAPEVLEAIRRGYGDVAMDVPVASTFGRYLIEYLIEHDFDVAHMRYVKQPYGGRIARRYPSRQGELDYVRETPPRPQGLPHAFSFVVKRLFDNQPRPILPVFQNTCYHPNQPTPRRAFATGEAIAGAIAEWKERATVAVIASGGLSHFVVDENLDRTLLRALQQRDAAGLRAIPRTQLYSAASEALNWVALGGAMQKTDLKMELLDYVPVYRTPAGTGGGWAFARWR